jgi:hypothetical protein
MLMPIDESGEFFISPLMIHAKRFLSNFLLPRAQQKRCRD